MDLAKITHTTPNYTRGDQFESNSESENGNEHLALDGQDEMRVGNERSQDYKRFTFDDYANAFKSYSLDTLTSHLRNTEGVIKTHERQRDSSNSEQGRANEEKALAFQNGIKELLQNELNAR